MAAEEKPAAQGTLATVVATAAVTLAIGITAAGFGGYLVPRGDANEKMKVDIADPAVAEARPTAAQPSAPNVVLVPIAPDSARAPATTVPAQSADEVLPAAYEPTGDHDRDDDGHHEGREHREREHEDDDDDHEED